MSDLKAEDIDWYQDDMVLYKPMHLLQDKKKKSTPEDVVYTPWRIAEDMVDFFDPSGECLDPCLGSGVFYELLPEPRWWCEIAQGVDFFDWKLPVDWIISNPPYSIFDQFLTHSLKIADNIVYLIPVNKLLSSLTKLRRVYEYGGIKHIRYYGTGRTIGFPFGFPVGAVYLKRGYKGPMEISSFEDVLPIQ
jgi:hypothetical protein